MRVSDARPSAKPSGNGASKRAQVAALMTLARRTAKPAVVFRADAPLASVTNAHRTNTVSEMRKALEGPDTQLEVDVRDQPGAPHALEARHDPGPGWDGDNLLLSDWLQIARASGRRIKLDVKAGERMPDIIAAVKSLGLPSGQVNWNLSADLTEKYGKTLRRDFPDAVLSLNAPGALIESLLPKPFTRRQTDWFQSQVKALGIHGVTLVAELEQLTPGGLATLEKLAPVSVYNEASIGNTPHPEAVEKRLRAEGDTGIVDLERTQNALGKLQTYIRMGFSMLEVSLFHPHPEGARKLK